MISCDYRRNHESTQSATCGYAADLLGGRHDLAIVSDSMCAACQEFFLPRPSDPNPVVASLLNRATTQIGDAESDLARWARQHLRCGNPDDPVTETGFNRNHLAFEACGFHATSDVRNHAVANRPCLSFVRSVDDVVGGQQHRSGWPFAFQSLQPLACAKGILFDDFVEHRFCYHVGAPGYQEPWVGIFHHPPDDFELAGYRNSLECMFQTKFWRDSEPYLLGGIALSEYLAQFLRHQLGKRFFTVMHPVAETTASQRWSPDAFLDNDEKKLIQIGWYLRNTHAIFEVGPIEGFTRWRLQHRLEQMSRYNDRVATLLSARGRPVVFSADVVDCGYVPNEQYDQLLTSNVVFCELLAASANNVVVDCIAARAPLVVNRHPAVEEYLGQDYPLFYDHISDVRSLLTTEQIIAAHEHLNELDHNRFSGVTFCRDVADTVRQLVG